MEVLANDMDPLEMMTSPPRRRRSTFFIRRDSLAPQTQQDDENKSVQVMETEEHDKRYENLTRYSQQLLAEKDTWKKEVNNRRNKYHDLRQQYQMAAKASSRSRISYACLTNEDIEFLKAKPNISKLLESQQKLHKSLKETKALYKRACELDNVVIKHCEVKVNTVMEHIWENSTIDAK